MSVGVSVLLGMDAEGSVPLIGLGVDGRVVLWMGLGTLGFGDAGVPRVWGGVSGVIIIVYEPSVN